MKDTSILRFKEIFSAEQLKFDEPMRKHTSFKTGGNADIFIVPYNAIQLKKAVEICRAEGFDFFVLGNGSNVLVRDRGFRGVIISVDKNMSDIEIVNDSQIKAEAGALLSNMANTALKNNLSGFEFASGIPGTIGGAVYMNAGAYDREIKDVFLSAEVLDGGGSVITMDLNDMEFGYRNSRIQKGGMIVLNCLIQLKKGDYNTIKDKMHELNKRRADKQPLEKASAGSTFKRPPGYFAGKLIMDSGLKGFSIGGAQVSEKHCGFIVNNGDATAKDIIDLITYVKNVVLDKFNVILEPEVRIIGEES